MWKMTHGNINNHVSNHLLGVGESNMTELGAEKILSVRQVTRSLSCRVSNMLLYTTYKTIRSL